MSVQAALLGLGWTAAPCAFQVVVTFTLHSKDVWGFVSFNSYTSIEMQLSHW